MAARDKLDRLQSQLLLSGLQKDNNPLYQVITTLIGEIKSVDTQLLTIINGNDAIVRNLDLITATDEEAILPNSFTVADIIERGLRSAQPLVTTVPVGTIYYVTDEFVIERSNGSVWQSYSVEIPINPAHGGSGTSTVFTTGSVIFAGAAGIYAQDNTNLFWDDTNNFLGIGTNIPNTKLTISNVAPPAPNLSNANPSASIALNPYVYSYHRATSETVRPTGGSFYTQMNLTSGAVTKGYGSTSTADLLSTDSVTTSIYGIEAIATSVKVSGVNTVYGGRFQAADYAIGAGTTATLIGSVFEAYAFGSSSHTVTNAYGTQIFVEVSGGAKINTARGCYVQIFGDSIIDSAYAFYAESVILSAHPTNYFSFFGASGSGPASFADGLYLPSLTTGSVLFAGASGLVSQDNANFFWDATNHRLGIGTTGPLVKLQIAGGAVGIDFNQKMQFDGSTGNIFAIGTTALTQNGLSLQGDANGKSLLVGNSGVAMGSYANGGTAIPLGAVIISGKVGIGTTIPTAVLHLKAGTATASSAPIKLTSGTVLTAAEAGAVEFNTDTFFATITTGAARKGIILDDGARLTSGKVPIATTNGRLIDGNVSTITQNIALTNQSADVGSTNFTGAGVAGTYRISYSLLDTTADLTAGVVVLTISFTDGAGVGTVVATQTLTTLGRTSGISYIQLASGNISYAVTHTGIYGTSKFALYACCERIS